MHSEYSEHEIKEARAQRARNRAEARAKLIELGVEFHEQGSGLHYVIHHNGKIVDYWPGTHVFADRRDGKHRHGLAELLKHVGVEVSHG